MFLLEIELSLSHFMYTLKKKLAEYSITFLIDIL